VIEACRLFAALFPVPHNDSHWSADEHHRHRAAFGDQAKTRYPRLA